MRIGDYGLFQQITELAKISYQLFGATASPNHQWVIYSEGETYIFPFGWGRQRLQALRIADGTIKTVSESELVNPTLLPDGRLRATYFGDFDNSVEEWRLYDFVVPMPDYLTK